jgi:uncharacterized membrane protein
MVGNFAVTKKYKMNTALWIAQGILAAMFLMAGIVKSTRSKEQLALKMPWVNDFSLPIVRLVGISELLAAIGLIVPQLAGIAPVLTGLAALGIALIMVLAAIYHMRKSEWKATGFNTVLFLVSLFVVYGRLFFMPSCAGS